MNKAQGVMYGYTVMYVKCDYFTLKWTYKIYMSVLEKKNIYKIPLQSENEWLHLKDGNLKKRFTSPFVDPSYSLLWVGTVYHFWMNVI